MARAQNEDLFRKLKDLPDVADVVAIKKDSMFSAGYEIRVRQPLDHADPGGMTFLQSVYVAHVDESKPVLFETEGYAVRAGGRARELATILRCNQIVVEHRFFGKSAPDSLRWKYLTTKQAADDHHHIATLLKTIYRGKWVSSGTSKGGQTALFYRYYYPLDVDASVPYVAPVNLSREDPRILKFLRTVGTPEERDKIKEFQISLLKREKEILPLIDSMTRGKNLTFSIGKAMAYEYSVLEFPCAFWQYGSSTASIPASDAPPDTMLTYLDRVASLFYYSDQGIKTYQPFQYQAYTEIGYYGYDITDFRGLLTAVTDPTNIILAPKNTDLTFNPAVMYNVYTWLRDYGNNIIYIYGETDLWGATAMELSGKTNAIKIVNPGGSHRTRIKDLPPTQQQIVYAALEEWLGIRIAR
ncbi:MAG TPA: S28 family serine protease [Bacteroidota bacterium]|nr:S28 family serine protease [Bacteroidota bacterium]